MDNQIRMCNIERKTNSQILVSQDLVSKINFLPFDDNVFLSCHYDGKVRQTDLRLPPTTRSTVFLRLQSIDLESSSRSASAIAFNPIDSRQFVLCGGDEVLRIFDLRREASLAQRYVRRLRAAELVENDRPSAINASGWNKVFIFFI